MLDRNNLFPVLSSMVKTTLGQRIPLKVTQYITHRCNLTCDYCGRIKVKIPELTTEEIKHYLREFRKLGTLFWSFNGGECLIRKDLGELIRYVRSLGMSCNIVTNGFFVPQHIDWIRNLNLVATSIDGPEEVQDKIRGKGAYKKNIKALEVLAKNNIRTVIVSVITKENINHLEHVLDLAEYYGHTWEAQPVVVHRSDHNNQVDRFRFDLNEFQDVIEKIIGFKKEGRPVFTSYDYLKDIKKFPNCEANMNCWSGRSFCALGADGAIFPCAEFVGTDINKIPVENGDVKKAFLSIPDMSKCNACYFSCYSEYNLLLNNKVKSSFRIAKNMMKNQWFWS